MNSTEHAAWMQRALRLAARGLYTTRPNPQVGAVIVKDGTMLGEGYHRQAGEAHAEVAAIKNARENGHDALTGSTMYVTLEPCSHYGRTPPCVDAIKAANIARVVIGMADPNPLVAGRGIRRLQEYGVEVLALDNAEITAFYAPYHHFYTQGTPYVRIKQAVSLDGHMADKNGKSQWITSKAARAIGHHLRAQSCAIITGAGTVRADNPRLTTRLNTSQNGAQHTAQDTPPAPTVRVVLQGHTPIPTTAHILNASETAPTCIVGADASQTTRTGNPHLWHIAQSPYDIRVLLKTLAARNIQQILIEAGPKVSAAFMPYAHELHLFYGLKWLCTDGLPAFLYRPTPNPLTDEPNWRIASLSAPSPIDIYAILHRTA